MLRANHHDSHLQRVVSEEGGMNQGTAHFPHPFHTSAPDPASPPVSVENGRKEKQGELEVNREEEKMR